MKYYEFNGEFIYKSVYDAPSTDEQFALSKVREIVLVLASTGEWEL